MGHAISVNISPGIAIWKGSIAAFSAGRSTYFHANIFDILDFMSPVASRQRLNLLGIYLAEMS
eukprot:6194655-Pleurochrysis_carterae.AAC.5